MSYAHRPLANLLCLAAVSIAATPACAADGAAAALPVERLALAVTVNGSPAPEAIVVERRGPLIWMAASDLRALGIAVAPDRQRVELQSIDGLRFTLDDATQTLALSFGETRRQHLRAAPPPPRDAMPVTPSGWGGVVSYDVSAAYQSRRASIGGLIEGTLYSPHGYAYASAIVSSGDPGDPRRVRRLDSGVTIADPAATRRINLGDFITGPTSFTRPVRLAGVQVTTDFSLRPDLITFPVPAIDAQAAVPSAVDLIVNGSRQSAGGVKAGQFSVSDVPVQTGLNTISVAVRDALGRERLQTVSTYTSTDLLTPGLSAYSVEAGFIRTGYGTRADRYRDAAASLGYRRGISDRLTLEGHAEATRALALGGAGAIVSLDRFGLLEVTAAASSDGRRGSGGQLTAAWQRIAHPVSVSARATVNSARWSDLASRNGSITRSYTIVVNASFDLGRFGAISGSLLDLGRGRLSVPPAYGPVADDFRAVDGTTFAVATYSVRLARPFSVVGSVGGDLRQAHSFYASVGLLVTFGSRGSGYGGVLARDGGISARADASRPALIPGDVGYRASVSSGGIERIAGGVEYLGSHGFYDLLGERTNGRVAVRGSTRGSLIAADGGVFATDRLDGSFALVDTNGQPGIAIYRDHRRIGATDRHGRLVVPNLRPYETTRIAFEPDELPIDASADDSEAMVRPAERSGAPVRFRIWRNSAITVRLVTEPGAPLAVGSRAAINGAGDMPIGFDGELYLLTSGTQNRVVARLPDGRYCAASFGRPSGYGVGNPPVVAVCRPVAIAAARQ